MVAEIIVCVLVVGVLTVFWVSLYDSNRFTVTRRTFSDNRIKKRLRAVVLADLHDKQFGFQNQHLLAAIREENPDIILIAGDLITAVPGEKFDKAEQFLKALCESYPVYYGYGNHEHRMGLYPKTYGTLGEEYDRLLDRLGVHRLINAHETLADYGITIYGAEIDRRYYERFGIKPMAEDYLESELGKPEESTYNILIAHNPDYTPQYVAWGADLSLAGHAHGGIVRLPVFHKGKWQLKGLLSPNVRFFPEYDSGSFEFGGRTVMISRGLGIHTIPIRFLNPGELIVLDFVPCNSGETLIK